MEVWGGDIDNAYLEATTKEKLYIGAGPEFEELQGHILVIRNMVTERLHDIMLQLGFKSCKADHCVWLREVKNQYEYIAIYKDD